MKLKERTRSQQGQNKEEAEEKGEGGEEDEDLIDTAEREFYAIIENEMKVYSNSHLVQ